MVNDEGAFTCSTMRRLQEDKAFDKNVLKDVKVNYREYVTEGASSSPVEVRPAVPSAPANGPGGARTMPRRARMSQADFDKFGYTAGCPGCEQLQLKLGQRRGHTEECRQRIEAGLAKTDVGQERLAKAKDRLDHQTAVIGQEGVVENKDDLQDLPEQRKDVIQPQEQAPTNDREELRPRVDTNMHIDEAPVTGGSSSSQAPMAYPPNVLFRQDVVDDAPMEFAISTPSPKRGGMKEGVNFATTTWMRCRERLSDHGAQRSPWGQTCTQTSACSPISI